MLGNIRSSILFGSLLRSAADAQAKEGVIALREVKFLFAAINERRHVLRVCISVNFGTIVESRVQHITKSGWFSLAAFCGLTLSSFSAAAIDINAYLEPGGVTKTFKYSSTTESGLEGMDTDAWAFEGRLVQVHGELESVNGNTTLTVVTHAEGLKDFPTGYKTVYVQETDGYYSSSGDGATKSTRSLIFPKSAQIGQTWKGNDFWDEQTLDAIVDYSGAGASYENCLRINRLNGDRTDLSTKVGERQHEVAIVCPGIGLVKSTVTNIINAIRFKTVTTIEILTIE